MDYSERSRTKGSRTTRGDGLIARTDAVRTLHCARASAFSRTHVFEGDAVIHC
jgi:hypothetical protein